MKFNRFLNNIFSFLLLLSITGCPSGGQPSDSQSSDSQPPTPPLPQNALEIENDFNVLNKKSLFGPVTHYSMTRAKIEKTKQEVKRLVVHEINVSPEFQTRAFQATTSDGISKVFLKPRLVLRSSLLSRDLEYDELKDQNQIRIHISIAMANGLLGALPTGLGLQSIPSDFVISNKKAFKEDIKAKIGENFGFYDAIACPKNLKIKLGLNSELPIQLKSKEMICPINKFFPAYLTLERRDWEVLQEFLIKQRTVELESETSLSVPVISESFKVQIRNEKLYNYLRTLINDSEPRINTERLDQILTLTVQKLQESLGQPFPDDQFISFRERVIHQYFSSIRNSQYNGNPNELIQYSLKDRLEVSAVENFELMLAVGEYPGRNISIRTRSRLIDDMASRQQILIDATTDRPLQSVDAASVGKLSPTFTTIRENEVLELKVSELFTGNLDWSAPRMTQETRRVCSKPFSLCLSGNWMMPRDPVEADFHKALSPDLNPGMGSIVLANGMASSINRSFAAGKSNEQLIKLRQVLEYRAGKYEASAVPGFNQAPAQVKLSLIDQFHRMRNEPEFHGINLRLKEHFLELIPLPSMPYKIDGRFNMIAAWTNNIPSLHWNCTNILPNQCEESDWETQTHKTTIWSIPIDQPRFRRKAIERSDLMALHDGLEIKFRFSGLEDHDSLVCPLSSLETEILPDNRILIQMRNTQGCSPFNSNNLSRSNDVAIDFVNRAYIESSYPCGNMVEDHLGNRKYNCTLEDGSESVLTSTKIRDESLLRRGERTGIHRPYYPRLKVKSHLRVLGRNFLNHDEEEVYG